MSFLFSTFEFTTTFTCKNYASYIPCPLCASVTIHCLIVVPEDTEFKCNKVGKIPCEEKHISLSLWMHIYFALNCLTFKICYIF